MNYGSYVFSAKEKIGYGSLYSGIILIFCKVFYDDFRFALAGVILLPLLFRCKRQILARERREKLSLEFKDFILSFCASLKTGYSVENAFTEAGRDLAYFLGEQADMVKECRKMEKQLQNNILLETLLSDFAMRSGQEEIKDFAAVFAIAKRSGGNIGAIIHNTSDIISEKIEVKREIQLLYASKRMEQNIMNIVPIAIIGYVRLTTPDYFTGMYHTVFGTVVMTLCLVVYGIAFFIAQKIMNIEV